MLHRIVREGAEEGQMQAISSLRSNYSLTIDEHTTATDPSFSKCIVLPVYPPPFWSLYLAS